MKLIAGLGNPGKEYEKSRHNVGFMILDYLKIKFGFEEFKEISKFKALITSGEIKGEKIILVKPLTFMNRSGESVRKVLDFYKIALKDLIICYDDLDLPFGTIRFREMGSGGTHNGMKSVIEFLGSENFSRFRLGIESRGQTAPEKQNTVDFVLNDFTEEEFLKIKDSIVQLSDKLLKDLI